MKTIRTVLLVFVCVMPLSTLAVITIKNNGYQGLEIVIHNDVRENLQLLDRIKDMVSKSSSLLYSLTKKRAYFQEVTIIVPAAWSDQPEYKKVPDADYFPTANVQIGPPHPSYQNTPYTSQPGGCGEFGRYIHITPEYILNYPDDGLAKVFVHEWFHLRYGVFDEYGIPDNDQFPMFYMSKGSFMYANSCPSSVKGWIRQKTNRKPCTIDRNGNVIGDCIFLPMVTPKPGETARASIMYTPHLKYSDYVCEDDDQNGLRHNIHAPNEHNSKCGQRSVRNVMDSSPDFTNDRNLPIDLDPNPKITVARPLVQVFPGYVLVLDVSTSMQGKPMQQLISATSRAIKYKAQAACPLGMVKFSDSSVILAPLTNLTDTTRNDLLNKIPKSAAGHTAIGQGLLSALEVLKDGNRPTEKGKIVLITDGEENVTPNIVDVTPQLVDADVIVYGLAFGDKATTKIENLCYVTGGKGWSYNADHLTQSLDSMLDEIFQNCGPLEDRPIINKNDALKLSGSATNAGNFHVDKDGTESVSITISYSGTVPSVSVTSPSGVKYTSQSPEYQADPTLKIVMFNIRTTESGKWTYELTNTSPNNIVINMMITSAKGNTAADPIRLNSWISDVNVNYPKVSKVYAELKKGILPVLKANVMARAFKPNGDVVIVALKDNGIGADATANDGIYTAYYTHYNGDGRYAIDIGVDSSGNAVTPAILPSNRLGASHFPYFPPDPSFGEPASSFSLSDLKQVDEEFQTSSLYRPGFFDNSEQDTAYEKVEDFERFSTAGTLILAQYQNVDLIPPAKITDLRVKAYSVKNRTVALEWTSPGDNMTDGKASSFELRYHGNLTTLLDSFDSSLEDFVILNGTLEPPEPFEVHSVVLKLPTGDQAPINAMSEAYYFAVRTLDQANNAADLSNMAFVSFYVHSGSSLTCLASGPLLVMIVCYSLLFK